MNLNAERALKESDNRLMTPRDMLEAAIHDIDAGESAPTSAVLILVEQDDDEGAFYCEQRTSNMKYSAALGWLELVKSRICNMMDGPDG